MNRLHETWRSLRIALALLTVIPVGQPSGASVTERRRSLYLFPLVGLIIGLLLCLFEAMLPAGSLLGALLLVAAWSGLTGGLHLDGLADSVDAWVGGHGDRRRTLTILRDPAAGPVAVTCLVLVLGLKAAALMVLSGEGAVAALLAAPMVARTALVVLYATTPYARHGGMGEVLRPVHGDRHRLWFSLVVSALLALLLLAGLVLTALLAVVVVFLLVRAAALKRLHGFTGDVAGAMVELVETALLIGVALALGG